MKVTNFSHLKVSNRKIWIPLIIANPSNPNNAFSCDGLLDTGAQDTFISDTVVNQSNLTPLQTAITSSDANDNVFSSNRHSTYIQFQGHSKTFTPDCGIINKSGVHVLIGMDIIELVELNIKDGIVSITT